MHVRLVPAHEEHRNILARVARDAELLYTKIMPGAFEELAVGFLGRPLPDWYRLQLVEADGVPVGFLGLAPLGDARLCIVALYLLNDCQRRGIGHATLQTVLDEWRPSEMVLFAHRDAHWAYAFYRRFGFTELDKELAEKAYAVGRLSRYLRDDYVWLRWRREARTATS